MLEAPGHAARNLFCWSDCTEPTNKTYFNYRLSPDFYFWISFPPAFSVHSTSSLFNYLITTDSFNSFQLTRLVANLLPRSNLYYISPLSTGPSQLDWSL